MNEILKKSEKSDHDFGIMWYFEYLIGRRAIHIYNYMLIHMYIVVVAALVVVMAVVVVVVVLVVSVVLVVILIMLVLTQELTLKVSDYYLC